MPDANGLSIDPAGTATRRPIAFNDLAAQRRRLGARIDQAVLRVIDRGDYILGREVGVLEDRLAAFSGARHAVTCSSGTDALALILMGWGIGPGDAVFVPAFTFAATAEVVALLGAVPVLCDVEPDSFTLDPGSLEMAVRATPASGLRPRAVIAVDLFGQPAGYAAIGAVARPAGMRVLADAAQSFGATLGGRGVGTLADATATSFFPAKPLGCYGDGGAVLTEDDELAELVRSLRAHGKGSHKYDNVRIGINGRLDTLQAAILIEKLAIFAEEILDRRRIASRYAEALQGILGVPRERPGTSSVWAQYTVLSPDRDRLADRLREMGVPTAVYYPLPLHRQTAYRDFPRSPGGLAVSESLARKVLSLPMHPYLQAADQDFILDAVRSVAG